MNPCCPVCPAGTVLEYDGDGWWCPVEERALSVAMVINDCGGDD